MAFQYGFFLWLDKCAQVMEGILIASCYQMLPTKKDIFGNP